jgi:hypothetical protein
MLFGWPRMYVGALVLFAVGGGAVTACDRPSDSVGTTTTKLEEASRYGADRVTGLLHVTSDAAYFDYRGRRIRLVSAAPMTAVGTQALLKRTAEDLRHLDGKLARAQGDLQGDILWGAQLTSSE